MEIRRLFAENFPGLWRSQGLASAGAEGQDVARCTVARPMKTMGFKASSGKARADDDQRQGRRHAARPG